jgi:putative ABC transport system permease protein
MFRHLLKPIWRRKSRNLMLSLEILLTFLVVFAIVATAGRFYQLYHLPTGFSYQDVWSVQLEQPDQNVMKNDAVLYEKFKRSLAALPEVEQVSFTTFSPYQSATWRTGLFLPGSGVMTGTDMMQVSDDLFSTVGLKLQRGRWF